MINGDNYTILEIESDIYGEQNRKCVYFFDELMSVFVEQIFNFKVSKF